MWANSPWASSYGSFWHTEVPQPIALPEDLRHWVNDGAMTLFFFVVGLEIKRELTSGELNDARKALLPVVAALGGMLIPALVYLLINPAQPEVRGWGIPMATDIAFVVGALALLGDRVPSGLKVFLLSLAIADDIGAIVAIAVFYASGLAPLWLVCSVLAAAVWLLLQRSSRSWWPVFLVLAAIAWYATFRSGVHATIAGVAVGLLTSARSRGGEPSNAERIRDRLHPWTSYAVIPLFALANAGLRLDAEAVTTAIGSPVAVGVAAGLVVGKLAGITLGAWIAVRLGIGRLPGNVGWSHLIGGAALAGIGFTVSLFITDLAFSDASLLEAARLGVFAGSLTAALIGMSLLTRVGASSD